ncbi:NAD(P)/FAD-dependent oxidoreductase [Eubacterium callanderi]|uniref:NAD(P)/FAD-dependent oxidoreductase n=1 Tax=Eubacterium callanderi TaxID=53442 RepID=UPI001C1057E1|nr:FAD-dependent oxidoreductase [Eubacterium callanderi]MBU5302643.1 FAD-dependent oxidoreductase [Eubacterium callanderi]WPK69711.1 NADH-dependent phenylglyoxylate dehydrogenase subunit epsilon [Eubacterium callanderi]WPK74009.1 NADH-dependent phenylglyoxylate dehydrogenase subunit epsilon [Eubacterium callanderi]
MNKTKYLIIGNSAGAIGGVTGIRREDTDGSITIISAEKHHTYSRPLISYWLEGKVSQEKMIYRDEDFYEKNACEVILGTKAERIDVQKKQVYLTGGGSVTYEKLLVATGSVPFVPPIKGRETAKNTFTFTTMDDAAGVGEILDKNSKVVILGAGLIGLKAAEAVVGQCAGVTVVDLADRVLPSVLDTESAEIIEAHLTSQGMVLKLETSITEIGDMEVTLSDGELLPYDILILAVGTRPEMSLVEQAGGKVERGIVTDDHQQTSLKDIYAAGDCTQSYDITSQTAKNMAILPNAYLQGEVAGQNMAGGSAVYEKAFPVNSMGLLGLYMLTAGSRIGESITVKTDESYKKFYTKDGVLKGYIIIGNCDRGGIYTDMIREQTPLETVDMEMLIKEPGLMAFNPGERYAKLSAEH